MRITLPKDGETRIVKGFLFLPKTLWNPRKKQTETRWLEGASWKQVYDSSGDFSMWISEEWVDDEEDEFNEYGDEGW